MTASGTGGPTKAARRLARCALLVAVAAIVVLLTALGGGGVLILVSGLAGLALSAVGIWWFLAHRGPLRADRKSVV